MKRQITIGEIAEINANSLTQKDMFQEIMYLDTGNITRNEIDNIQVLNGMIDKIPSRAKRKVKDKTIIYSTVRPNQEHYGFLENPSDNFIVSTGFSTIDVYDDNTDEKFIYYLLTQKHITDYLHTIGENSVSSYPSINPDDIANLKFIVPDLKTQQSIAAVLSALDKKIALNKQINARLEEMAKTLYDYWFVQFDFPDANGKPYKSSGGEMVFDETLKREIPKGWEVKSLGEVITHSTTGLNPRDNFSLGNGENFYVTIKNIKDNEIKFHTCAKITDEALNVINKRSKLDKGDILFTSIEPIGSTYLLHEKPKNWDINESVFSIRSKSDFITPYFLFMLLSSDEIKSFTRQVSTGSVHKGIRHESLKRFTFAYSGIDLIKNFTNLISPMQQNIFFLQKQNHHLTQLRDFLLPMLMNGQVSVAE